MTRVWLHLNVTGCTRYPWCLDVSLFTIQVFVTVRWFVRFRKICLESCPDPGLSQSSITLSQNWQSLSRLTRWQGRSEQWKNQSNIIKMCLSSRNLPSMTNPLCCRSHYVALYIVVEVKWTGTIICQSELHPQRFDSSWWAFTFFVGTWKWCHAHVAKHSQELVKEAQLRTREWTLVASMLGFQSGFFL